MRIQLVTLLLVLTCTSVRSQDLGFVVSKKMLPQITKKLLKGFQNSNGTVVVPLETINIYPSFAITELTESQGLEIVKQVSSFRQYDQMDTHLSLAQPKLNIDLSDSMDISVQQINNEEYSIRGYFLINKIAFNTPQLMFCDRTDGKCLPEDRVVATDAELIVNSSEARADFEFKLIKLENTLKFSLVSFSTNFETLLDDEVELNIKGRLSLPKIFLEVNGQRKQIDTSGFKKALLKHKKWLARKILNCTSEYLVDGFAVDITELLADYPLETSIDYESKSLDRYFKNNLNTKSEENFIPEMKRDRIPLILQPKIRSEKSLKAYFELMIKKATLDYSLLSLVSNQNALGASFKTDVSLNGQALRDDNNQNKLNIRDISNTNNVAFLFTEDIFNNLIKISKQTGFFKSFFNFIQDEKGTEFSDLNIRFDNKYVFLDVGFDIVLKDKSAIGAFIERNNNNAIITVPLTLKLMPYFVRNSSGSFISFRITDTTFKDRASLKNYLSVNSSSFKDASFIVKNQIADGVLELVASLKKTKIPAQFNISSKIKLIIESFKIDNGISRFDFHFSKREEFLP